MTHSQTIKESLILYCHQWVEERIHHAQTAMNHAQDAANSEEKSSAGDKYETGRAMAQNERDRAAQQLQEALVLRGVVQQLNANTTHTQPALGSLVTTNHQTFFLSISVGKIVIDQKEFTAISTQSPIGKLLLQTKMGHSFTFNKQLYTVMDVK